MLWLWVAFCIFHTAASSAIRLRGSLPCEPIYCFTCHNSNDFACWITGRYEECREDHTCHYSKKTLANGKTVVYRGCKAQSDCPATNTPKESCSLGSDHPPVPEKKLYVCKPPETGTCSCKGDPHCRSFDDITYNYLNNGCLLTFARDACVKGEEDGKPSFEVLIQPEFTPDESKVVVGAVEIRFGGAIIYLGKDRHQMTVNGAKQGLSAGQTFTDSAAGFSVADMDDKMVKIELYNGVVVEYDFENQISVTVPKGFMHKTCGICGNFGRDGLFGDLLVGPANGRGICPNLPGIISDAGLSPGDKTNMDRNESHRLAFAMSWFRGKSSTDRHCHRTCNE